MKIVIALGGNALEVQNDSNNQELACKKASKNIINIIKNNQVLISHGNGPQVGNLLLQQENSVKKQALYTLGAMTQGMIGFLIQNSLYYEFQKHNIKKNIATILTQTLVSKSDPAFLDPTKFIGPFYTEKEVEILQKEKNWIIKKDANRGYRRVVGSPYPIDIIEKDLIKNLFENDNIIIASGGGGIPVYLDKENDILKLTGIDAVVDKDFASAKLAEIIEADLLMILTAVDNVCLNFGKEDQEILTNINIKELKEFIKQDQFPPGSMLPKVQACIDFVEKTQKKAIITSLNKVDKALDGFGTHIN